MIGFPDYGLGFKVQGVGRGASQGLGFWVLGLRFRGKGLGVGGFRYPLFVNEAGFAIRLKIRV